MPRVIGLDAGTVSLDCCGLEDGLVYMDWTLPTAEVLGDPQKLVARMLEGGPPELIAGPSGYGLPLVYGSDLTEDQIRLAVLPDHRVPAGLGGLSRLMRLLAGSGLPVVFTPGVIHLATVPDRRKLNRIDMGTADKVAAAAMGVAIQAQQRDCDPGQTSFILLELGGAFTATLAVDGGQIVDGIGGTAGPMGWRSGGGWDGEVAWLGGSVSKADLFQGGVESVIAGGTAPAEAYEAYLESAEKAVRQMQASVHHTHEILLSGRHANETGFGQELHRRLKSIAPSRFLSLSHGAAKAGAMGAAILADGLAGGQYERIVDALALRECHGTVLDHLVVIDRAQALDRLKPA